MGMHNIINNKDFSFSPENIFLVLITSNKTNIIAGRKEPLLLYRNNGKKTADDIKK